MAYMKHISKYWIYLHSIAELQR